jgi:hypothetical protein
MELNQNGLPSKKIPDSDINTPELWLTVARWYIFKQKIQIWLIFGGLFYNDLVYFTTIWSILQPFGLFYNHLVYFTTIWSILQPFGMIFGNLVYFPPFGNVLSRIIWQPCSDSGTGQHDRNLRFLWATCGGVNLFFH